MCFENLRTMQKEKGKSRIKCVLIGDSMVGKTRLVYALVDKEKNEPKKMEANYSDTSMNAGTSKTYPGGSEIYHKYSKTHFDNFQVVYQTNNNKAYEISLFDTAGAEDFDQIRKLSYPQTDIFIICFSLNSLRSFNNVFERWIPDIEKYRMPALIVGCKLDAKLNKIDDSDKIKDSVISSRLKNYLNSGKYSYIPCSAIEKDNTDQILRTIIESKERFDKNLEREMKWKTPGFFRKILNMLCCRPVFSDID